MASIDHPKLANGKRGRWRARVRRKGLPPLTQSFDSAANAHAWARKIESEQERGVWRDTSAAESMTLLAALRRYAREVTPAHRGAAKEAGHIKVLEDEPLARRSLASIRRANIKALRDVWIKDGYAVATVNRRLTILHAVFATAAGDWEMRGLENPCDSLKLKGATERDRRVSQAEIDAICLAARDPAAKAGWLAPIVTLAVETAMRRGELCKLAWPMVDAKARYVRLPAGNTKANKSRDVPLSPRALECLRGLHRKGELVFGGVDGTVVTQSFKRATGRARKAYVAERKKHHEAPDDGYLADLHFHDLRHEAISRLAKIFELHELMKIVGHSSPAMLMKYYHPKAADFAQRLADAATG